MRNSNSKRGNRFKDLTGLVFDRLRVVGEHGRSKSGSVVWACECECGAECAVTSGNLVRGATKSCGCLRKTLLLQGGQASVTHGMSYLPEYRVWVSMWDRCTNKNNKSYPLYRDREPPPEWRDFGVFYAELGPRPSPFHSLDRIRNAEPYGPGNCKWSTNFEQSSNTRRNIYVTLGGVRMHLSEACRQTGLGPSTTANKFHYWGDMDKASKGLFQLSTQEGQT